jgi:hypothetical protein
MSDVSPERHPAPDPVDLVLELGERNAPRTCYDCGDRAAAYILAESSDVSRFVCPDHVGDTLLDATGGVEPSREPCRRPGRIQAGHNRAVRWRALMTAATEQGTLDVVREDPELTPEEKETSFHFTKRDDDVRVFTAEAGLTRRLLSYREFNPDTLLLKDGGEVESVEHVDTAEDTVVGVLGYIPIGAFKIRSSSRVTSSHAAVLSHRSERDHGGESE